MLYNVLLVSATRQKSAICIHGASLVAQRVKHLSTMRKSQVQSLGWEDPLGNEMAIHSSTIAWKIPWTEERGRLQSMGLQRVRREGATSLSLTVLSTHLIPFSSVQSLSRVRLFATP